MRFTLVREDAMRSGTLALFGPLFVGSLRTPVGRLWVETDDRAVQRVLFENPGRGRPHPPRVLEEALTQLGEYFNGRRKHLDLPLPSRGSVFRQRVWGELARIPHGRVKSYQELADTIGSSARAVGGACSVNPIPIIVPCHRVLASNGLLTGYVGGIWRKRWLLEHEGVFPKELFNDA
jgi:methylated-DNA-[protein]-cysteine S-methyltransferase